MFFDDVYKKYYNELRCFGHQMNISPEKSEDFTQETFLKFYLETKKNIEFKNPRAWLYKVYLNLARTCFNSEALKKNKQEILSGSQAQMTDLHKEYSRNEKQRIVFEMLDKLTEKEKAILILYNHGFSYSEMAEVLEINPNSVGTTLVRAIERLKETLRVHYHEMFEQN
jgi:RNA polymerase sigma-70 factor (ECF subfamily)